MPAVSQVCRKCSHANPPEANYCYYDGAVLEGHGVNGGPVNVGSAPFPTPFVFPNGQQCRNFDQLAMACQQNWPAAVNLLRQGFLGSFLGGIGRVDLAMAAQEAARFPDLDRGLDQLLDKLPTQVLQRPRLLAEPSEINLGVATVGADRDFQLHLANQGMRLLYGSVVSDSKWLTLGEGQGNAQKLFQFGGEGTVHVQVRGQHLRAGNKPLEGHLIIESNGGQAAITVKVDVPVRPFREGVLAGAISPRQIAEKAKAQPKEAAALFERGAVAAWFKENGWTYPVQGPSASGLGAVQQFFEALGLATAPKVEVSQRSIALQGNVGQPLETQLEVKTQEKRPVYAHATCDQPWVDVSQTTLNGRIATISVRIPAVPPRPGETLQANIHVAANGNQRFTVPLSLTVSGTGGYPVSAPVVQPAYPAAPVLQPAYPAPAYAQPIMAQAVPVAAVPVNPFAFDAPAPVPAAPVVPIMTAQPVAAVPVSPAAVSAVPLGPAVQTPMPVVSPRRPREKAPPWVHLAPAAVLVLVLLALIVRDLFQRGGGSAQSVDGIPIDPAPRVQSFSEDGGFDELGNRMVPRGRFGVVALDPKHPGAAPKKLTYDRYGRTNTTVVRIDGNDRVYGAVDGKWEKWEERPLDNNQTYKTPAIKSKGKFGGDKVEYVWLHNEGVQVTQIVEVIPGEPVETPDGFKRLMDTTLVRYVIENKDNRNHRVGLRIVVDTLIGENDGVPFTVPGVKGLVDTCADFRPPEPIPDFAQVLERPDPDLRKAGLVALMNFKVGGGVEPPSRVSLTAWPGNSILWEVPVRPMGSDSAVVMYWDEKDMKPGDKREIGFSYGLGSVSSSSGQLGVSVAGNFGKGEEFSVIALVSNPQPNQKVKISLPKGLRLAEGQQEEQAVPPPGPGGRPSPVTWRVISSEVGTYDVEVTSGGATQKRRVQIKSETIF